MTVQEDLDHADDIGLLSSKHQDDKQIAEHPSQTASTIGLKVNTKKTQVQRKNTRVNEPVMIDEKIELKGVYRYKESLRMKFKEKKINIKKKLEAHKRK